MARKSLHTGASGFIGSAIFSKLIRSGYGSVAKCPSDGGMQALFSAGAEACLGVLDDLDSLRKRADAVFHTAFHHDSMRFKSDYEADGRSSCRAASPRLLENAGGDS